MLFIGVSFQTYFITPCARELSGRVALHLSVPSLRRSFPSSPLGPLLPPATSCPLSLVGTHAPPAPLSPAGGGGCAACLLDRQDPLSPLGPPADRCLPSPLGLATRSARYGGSLGSIPASGGGSGSHGRHGRYCSLVLKGLLPPFHLTRTIAGKRALLPWAPWEDWSEGEGNTSPSPPRSGAGPWSGCRRHGAASEALGVLEPRS